LATKDTIIFQALLRVNGGVLTSDSSTRYGEAEVYLAAAFNYIQIGNYWLENKAEETHAINPFMLTPFNNIAIQTDTLTGRKYSDLPSKIIFLSKGRSLEISTQSGKRLIPLTQGDESLQEYYGKYSNQIKYQIEGPQRVYYYGMEKYPLLNTTVRAKYIVQIMDLPGDAEILLPADGEVKVLDMMFQWLSGEKQMPKDYVLNGKDNQ
jgi:hypothetical protein